MLIASMIARVDPRRAEEVSRQVGRIPGVTSYGVHRKSNIVIVAEARDEAQLENLSNYLLDSFDEILGVYPTFIASDEEPLPAGHDSGVT